MSRAHKAGGISWLPRGFWLSVLVPILPDLQMTVGVVWQSGEGHYVYYTSFYPSAVFSKPFSQWADSSSNIQQIAWATQAINNIVGGTIVELFKFVEFSFCDKLFISMFNKITGFAQCLFSPVHAYNGMKAKLRECSAPL